METTERAIWQALQSIIAPFYRLSAHACQKLTTLVLLSNSAELIRDKDGWLVGRLASPFSTKQAILGTRSGVEI